MDNTLAAAQAALEDAASRGFPDNNRFMLESAVHLARAADAQPEPVEPVEPAPADPLPTAKPKPVKPVKTDGLPPKGKEEGAV